MTGTHLLKRVGALVVTLATLIALPTYAATVGAQLGLVQTGGDLISGGTITYQLNVTVTSPGELVAKATLRAKGFKATFPVLSNSLSVGFASLNSDAISIPTNFHGLAVLQVKAKFAKRSLPGKTILVTIDVPPTMPVVPQSTWYDVGFNSNVTVNAGSVSTNGLTPPFTYTWIITDTDMRTNAALAGANTATPTLTTLPITSFTNPVVFTSHVAPGIDLSGLYDLDTNPNLVGVNYEQVGLSTYHLQVVVSDATEHSATGEVTAISTSVSPAQPTLPLGERQYFTAVPNGTNASTYSWSFATNPDGSAAIPDRSTAVLENPRTRTASLRPDVEGDYVLQLTVTGGGVSTSSYITVEGATYKGVATCASCHGPNPQVGLTDMYTPWSQTEHATMAQRGIDGLLSPDYNESCFACHTLGYNQAPLATNGNFYAVAKQIGWTFPTVLQIGNYAAMPTNLQNLANIQCESCHGPGSEHPGPNSVSLDVAVCAQCHQDGQFHNRPSQWSLGPHGADDGYLSVSIDEAPNSSCSKCHSPTGFVDWQEGQTPVATIAGRLTCAGCHDPHNVKMFPESAHQVRVYDTVTLDDSVAPTPPTLTGQGPSAVCEQCHNARRSPPATYASATTLPHESTATDVLNGLRASTNVEAIIDGVTNTIAGVTLENSAHAGVAKCINCHMYQAGNNTVGDHTFSMTDRLTGNDNLAACNQCHAGVDPVTDFDHKSVVASALPHGGDYDGDGVANGVQTEVTGLLTNLVNKMLSTGMTIGSGGSHWTSYTNRVTFPVIYAAQRNAAWNEFLLERELSAGVHNTAFTVRLLQWTYTVLSTNTGGNSFEVDYPNADLR
jgi:hypothetical protein